MNKLIILFFAMIVMMSCKKEESVFEGIYTNLSFVLRDSKTKKAINMQENETVPRFYYMNKGVKKYIDGYNDEGTRWMLPDLDEGANSVRWTTYYCSFPNKPQSEYQGGFISERVVTVSYRDKVETFGLEWKGKDLGKVSIVFSGTDQYGSPIIKDAKFNNLKTEKELSICPNAFIFDVEL